MKRVLTILLFVALPLTASCSAPIRNNTPDHFFGKSYEIESICEAAIGEPMITLKNAYLFPSFRPKYKFQPINKNVLPIDPSQEWVAYHYYENHYLITSKDYYNGWLGVICDKSGKILVEKPFVDMRILTPNPMQKPIWHRLNLGEINDIEFFEPSEGHPKEGSFKAELIYNGVMRNVLAISYREYNDNMARPAFFQDLRYDLNETDTISFRTIKLKVYEANNSKIQFSVLGDDNLPWMP